MTRKVDPPLKIAGGESVHGPEFLAELVGRLPDGLSGSQVLGATKRGRVSYMVQGFGLWLASVAYRWRF